MIQERKLLTIAIPTYNRCKLAIQQAAWILEHTKGYEQDVEVMVCDNASPDDTWNQLNELKIRFPRLIIHRNVKNIGPNANFIQCARLANGEFLWMPSDDDRVSEKFIKIILETINKHNEIAYIHSNNIMGVSNAGTYTVAYDIEKSFIDDGLKLFIACHDAVLFPYWIACLLITANVVRTKLFLQGMDQWTGRENNLLSYLFGLLYCMSKGKAVYISEPLVTDIGLNGETSWEKEKPRLYALDLPELILKLRQSRFQSEFVDKIESDFKLRIDQKLMLARHLVLYKWEALNEIYAAVNNGLCSWHDAWYGLCFSLPKFTYKKILEIGLMTSVKKIFSLIKL